MGRQHHMSRLQVLTLKMNIEYYSKLVMIDGHHEIKGKLKSSWAMGVADIEAGFWVWADSLIIQSSKTHINRKVYRRKHIT